MLTFNSAQELASAPVNPGVRHFIATCTDLTMLRRALDLERGGPTKRLVRLVQLQDRIEELGGAAPAPSKPAKLDPKLAPNKAVAKSMAQVPTVGIDDFLGEMMGDRAAPVQPPAPVLRAKNAATVLMSSILDGNAVTLASILRAVAIGGYDMDELALHLIEHGAKLAPLAMAKPVHRVATGPTDTTIDLAGALVQHHDRHGDITSAAMKALHLPDSWLKYRAPWYARSGTVGKALLRLGYVARCRTVSGNLHVTLLSVDSDEGRAVLAAPELKA